MLDTNICIYAMKNRPGHVLQKLKDNIDKGLCISSITLAEFEYGIEKSIMPEKNRIALLQFLVLVKILPFGNEAAIDYGQICSCLHMQGKPIGPLDMLIAAHARSEDLILVTNNVREFARVPDLYVENWV